MIKITCIKDSKCAPRNVSNCVLETPCALTRIARLSFAVVRPRALTFSLVICSRAFANRTGIVPWTRALYFDFGTCLRARVLAD
jgi:hypothetical protein